MHLHEQDARHYALSRRGHCRDRVIGKYIYRHSMSKIVQYNNHLIPKTRVNLLGSKPLRPRIRKIGSNKILHSLALIFIGVGVDFLFDPSVLFFLDPNIFLISCSWFFPFGQTRNCHSHVLKSKNNSSMKGRSFLLKSLHVVDSEHASRGLSAEG